MINKEDLSKMARNIPFADRVNCLMQYSEVELHHHLENLYYQIQSDQQVFITHGTNELGKDLIIIQPSKIAMFVTAVIVKKGVLSGKSSGAIDDVHNKISRYKNLSKATLSELESQVRQSSSHNANIEFSVENFKIDKIILVIVGNITHNALKRLEELTSVGIIVQDIKWLVDNFTEYYPQVYFESDLYDFVSDQIISVEQEHWLSKKNINLSEYYVNPTIIKYKYTTTVNEKTLEELIQNQPIDFSEFKSFVDSNKAIIIVGEPGTGKTGLLNKLTLEYLSSASHDIVTSKHTKAQIPIYIRATDLYNIEDISEINARIPQEVINRIQISGIFVDALDELHSNKRLEVVEKAKRFSEQLSCAVIITSRNISCLHNIDHGFAKYELLPFDIKQAVDLFRKLYKNDFSKIEILSKLYDELCHQVSLAPLSLHLLIELVEYHHEAPASVTELYQRYFDMIFGRWDIEKGLSVLFDYVVLNSYLSKLAYECYFKQSKIEIDLNDYHEFTKQYCIDKDYSIDDFNNLISVVERSGVLRVDNQVYFKHRTFLDYFTGLYIHDNKEQFSDLMDFLSEIYYDDVWYDVSFYYVGHERILKSVLLEKLLQRTDDSFQVLVSKLELGRLLQAGWNSDRSVKHDTILNSVKYASICRERLYNLTKDAKFDMIYNDFLVLILAELSFGSFVISKSVLEIVNQNLSNLTEDNIYDTIVLIWASRRHIEIKQLSEHIDILLKTLPKMKLKEKELINLYRFLEIISKKDELHHEKIIKRLSSIFENNKDINRKFIRDHVLPQKRK
jgi:hypothetical protein